MASEAPTVRKQRKIEASISTGTEGGGCLENLMTEEDIRYDMIWIK